MGIEPKSKSGCVSGGSFSEDPEWAALEDTADHTVHGRMLKSSGNSTTSFRLAIGGDCADAE